MEKITKQEIETFQNMYNKFDGLVDEIIKYIEDKKYTRYLTGFNEIAFGFLICTSTFDIRICEYGTEDGQDYCDLEIPWEHIYNDTWREFIDELVREDIEKENARQQKVKQMHEEREKEELKRLLKKYGNQETV